MCAHTFLYMHTDIICLQLHILMEHHPDAVVPIYHLKAISIYYCKHFQHREHFKDNSTCNYFQMVNVNIIKVLLHRPGFMDTDTLNLIIEKCTFVNRQMHTCIWTHHPTDEPTGFFILLNCPGHRNF